MNEPHYHGYHPATQRPVAVVIPAPVPPEERDRLYARLAPGTRHHPRLAKLWKVWAVCCTEDWAIAHANRAAAPKPNPARK